MLDYKLSLNRFKKIDIIQSIFSNYNRIIKNKTGKFTNLWKLNNTLLSNQDIKEEITREIRKYLEKNDNKDTTYQNLQDVVKALLKEKKTRPQISNLTLQFKELEKEELNLKLAEERK